MPVVVHIGKGNAVAFGRPGKRKGCGVGDVFEPDVSVCSFVKVDLISREPEAYGQIGQSVVVHIGKGGAHASFFCLQPRSWGHIRKMSGAIVGKQFVRAFFVGNKKVGVAIEVHIGKNSSIRPLHIFAGSARLVGNRSEMAFPVVEKQLVVAGQVANIEVLIAVVVHIGHGGSQFVMAHACIVAIGCFARCASCECFLRELRLFVAVAWLCFIDVEPVRA